MQIFSKRCFLNLVTSRKRLLTLGNMGFAEEKGKIQQEFSAYRQVVGR